LGFKSAVLLFLTTVLAAQGQRNIAERRFPDVGSSDAEVIGVVTELKAALQTNDKEHVAKLIKFPLRYNGKCRTELLSKVSFLRRFNEIFDQPLRAEVEKESVENLRQIGWRGVMIGNGSIWIYSSDHVTKIQVVNGADRDKVPPCKKQS
jgi:hypothetical protein